MIISDAQKIFKGSTEVLRAFAGGSQVWPKIVTDGLVLHLDAGDVNSYPGSGTTWYDLSGNGNNGTLVNGVGYEAANNGSMTFDHSNDYCNVMPIHRTVQATIEVWFNTSSVSSDTASRQYLYTQQRNPPLLAQYTYQERQGVHVAGNLMHFQYFSTDNAVGTVKTLPGSITANRWHHVTATIDGITACIYIDGIASGFLTKPSKATSVTQGFIGRRGDAQGNDFLGGKIAIVREYCRALSVQEVKQNFNATRLRYGL
ncbi:MAG: LamG domain-containing protein [Chlorobium phaeovibrioides]|nr:LamG domain-containing protein [Chlorobium phaeovibrioides]